MIDGTDIKILSAISSSPIDSIESLAKATSLSPSGLAKRIKHLVSTGFLGQEFVRAQISLPAVGMEPLLVLVESPPSMWKALESACDAHPYTQYRIRVMGTVNGFLIIFAMPNHTKALILEFLDALNRSGVITKYDVHSPISDWGHSETRFEMYDPTTGTWKFDWEKWGSKIDESKGELRLAGPSTLQNLDSTDIAILRSYSKNARLEKKQLAEEIGLRDYELSRRLRYLEEKGAFQYFNLSHETGVLGMVSTVILRCKCSIELTKKVVSEVSSLPFQGSVYPLEDGFLVIANIPPGELTSLITTMQKRCHSVELMWGDYHSSMKYFFDNDPSNFTDLGWNTDRTYVVEAPLGVIRDSIPAKVVNN